MLRGNGPCNDQRLAQRRTAHENGAWVRDAAAAYAAKHTRANTGPSERGDGGMSGTGGTSGADTVWPLWEVFIRSRRGLSHTHAGSLHAPDAEMALRNARDLYTRRSEGVSIWVIPAAAVTASSPDEKDPFFEPAGDKVYRHPTFYDIPEGVEHL